MTEINLFPAPAQRFAVVLDGQACVIMLYVRDGHTYLDLDVDDTPVLRGAICHDRQNIVRFNNAFRGALAFIDQNGVNDPIYSGFGKRFRLCYFSAEEMSK